MDDYVGYSLCSNARYCLVHGLHEIAFPGGAIDRSTHSITHARLLHDVQQLDYLLQLPAIPASNNSRAPPSIRWSVLRQARRQGAARLQLFERMTQGQQRDTAVTVSEGVGRSLVDSTYNRVTHLRKASGLEALLS